MIVTVGDGDQILVVRIGAVLSPKGNAMQRLRDRKYEEGKLVDVTRGESTGAMVLLIDGTLLLSPFSVRELTQQIQQECSQLNQN